MRCGLVDWRDDVNAVLLARAGNEHVPLVDGAVVCVGLDASRLQSVVLSYEIVSPRFLASGQVAIQCSPVPPVGILHIGHFVY